MEELRRKIEDKSATLGVIGLGYVGLPLAVEKAKAGFKTIGFDVQQHKVDKINQGKNYVGDIPDDLLRDVVDRGLLSATRDFDKVASADCVCICVPTPLDIYQQPDLGYLESSAKSIVPYMRRGMLIVLESTTYPGTTREFLLPILEKSGLKCGQDFCLAFSPERVDPGNNEFKTGNTPKIVGGIYEECTQMATVLYENILNAPVYTVSSTDVAEMEKILENTYRYVNVGLINEMALLCDKMGINVWEVIDAAKTKPYGFKAFYPGPGIGGHCIPLDPFYLSWKAREHGFHLSMLETSTMINDRMPEYCLERTSKILNSFQKAINGSKILVLGVAYKEDVGDYRESPAVKIIEALEEEGAEVVYYDSFIPEYRNKGKVKKGEPELTAELIKSADLVLIAASHSNVDYQWVQRHAQAVFDTRNAMQDVENRDNIFLL